MTKKKKSAAQLAAEAKELKDKVTASDDRRKIADLKVKAAQQKNAYDIKSLRDKAAQQHLKDEKEDAKSSGNDSESNKQAFAGSDVQTVTKIIGGQIVNVPIAKPKAKTAEQQAQQQKERRYLRHYAKQLKGDGDHKLAHVNQVYTKDVEADAKKIAKLEIANQKHQKIQNSYQDFLNAKGGDVSKANENIKAIDQNIEKLNKQLSSSKRKDEKKTIAKKIANFNKDKAKDAEIIKQFDGTSAYQNWVAKNKRAASAIKNNKQAIAALKVRKEKTKGKMNAARAEIKARKRAANKLMERENGTAIESSIKQDINPYNGQQGHTYFYRTDKKSQTLLKLYEISPTEDNQVNVPTKPIDEGLPLEHFAQNSSLTLSSQYDIVGGTYDERVEKYNTLRKWSNAGVVVTVRGFSKWYHVFLTDISRTVSQDSNANTLQLNIQMQYARLAKIKTAKGSKGKKSKAHTSKKQGSSKSSKRTVKVKPGMTYSQIASKMGVKVSTLEKNNPKYKARDLPVGAKVEV